MPDTPLEGSTTIPIPEVPELVPTVDPLLSSPKRVVPDHVKLTEDEPEPEPLDEILAPAPAPARKRNILGLVGDHFVR